MLRNTMLEHRVSQRLNHVITVESSGDADRQAFARELIDQSQEPQTAAIVRARLHKIVAPDMVGLLRPQSNARSVVEPQSPPRFLFGRNLQALAPPDPLYPVLAYLPPRHFQQRGDPPVPKASVLAGQGDDGFRQLIFIAALCGLVTLRAARLAHQTARMPFTQAFLPSVVNGDPAPLGT